ncbi:MAG: Fis family transcriptional regulator, partial [Pyrinomonadaceae bacterium]|nr:Fis family transcriptional regulator [Sphingobacteriaceae bacterium]
MAIQASNVRLSFSGTKALPTTDTAFTRYTIFKKTFGEDGSIMVLGVQSPNFWQKETFNAWRDLTTDIQKLHGIKQVLSLSNLMELKKDTINQKFLLQPVIKADVSSATAMDSIKNVLYGLRFYEGLVFNSKTNTSLMAITFDGNILNSSQRIPVINSILEKSKAFSKTKNLTIHYSGLPYIRTIISKRVS